MYTNYKFPLFFCARFLLNKILWRKGLSLSGITLTCPDKKSWKPRYVQIFIYQELMIPIGNKRSLWSSRARLDRMASLSCLCDACCWCCAYRHVFTLISYPTLDSARVHLYSHFSSGKTKRYFKAWNAKLGQTHKCAGITKEKEKMCFDSIIQLLHRICSHFQWVWTKWSNTP